MSTINGGNGKDTLAGTADGDFIDGGNGSDTLDGGAGDDTLEGGNGADTLAGGEGDDTLLGENGDDSLDGGAGSDTIDGGRGWDTVIYLGALSAYRFALLPDGSIRILHVESGDIDTVRNVEQFVFDDATLAAHSLPFGTLTAPNETGGNDIVLGDAAFLDESLGTDGIDNVTYDGAGDILLPDNIENVTVSGDADVSVTGNDLDNAIVGNAGNNTLYSGDGDDYVDGGDGDDLIIGGSGAGNDTYVGGSGSDTVSYASTTLGVTVDLRFGTATGAEIGSDTLSSIENIVGGSGADALIGNGQVNRLEGGAGDDTIGGGLGDDTLIGGEGFDTVRYALATSAVAVDLSNGTASGGGGNDTLSGFEAAVGSMHDDLLVGDSGPNLLEGGDGNDTLAGGPGDDMLVGGDGFDTARYGLAGAAVTVDLSTGIATGGAGADALDGIEAVVGSAYDDLLIGNAGDNRFTGGDGSDELRGGGGNDVLIGGAGDDTIFGGLGVDIARFAGLRSQYNLNISGFVSGPDGTDSLGGIELLEFDDRYVLTSFSNAVDVTELALAAGKPIFSGLSDSTLSIGFALSDHAIDLGGGIDTVQMTRGGTYTVDLANVEFFAGSGLDDNVTFVNTPNGLQVDLGFGPDDFLNLTAGNDVVTVTNTEWIFGYAGADTVTLVQNDFAEKRIFLGENPGEGDTLILAGTQPVFDLHIGYDPTVIGATGGDEIVNLRSPAGGATFDLGVGGDAVNLYAEGINSLTVKDVEVIHSFGDSADLLEILDGSATDIYVTLGTGIDQVWGSSATEHFRFESIEDAPYTPAHFEWINDFDFSDDNIYLDGVAGSYAFTQHELAGGPGTDDYVLRIDVDGDLAWDMMIGLGNTSGNPNDLSLFFA